MSKQMYSSILIATLLAFLSVLNHTSAASVPDTDGSVAQLKTLLRSDLEDAPAQPMDLSAVDTLGEDMASVHENVGARQTRQIFGIYPYGYNGAYGGYTYRPYYPYYGYSYYPRNNYYNSYSAYPRYAFYG